MQHLCLALLVVSATSRSTGAGHGGEFLTVQKKGTVAIEPATTVNHLKVKGNGYVPGSPLYPLQQALANTTTGSGTTPAPPQRARTEATQQAASGGVISVRWDFIIVSALFTIVPFVIAVVLGQRAKTCLSHQPQAGFYERMFLVHWNPTFGFDFELAIRGAIFACIAACPMFFPPFEDDGNHHDVGQLWYSGRYGASAVVMFLFTLYKTVGDTLNFAFVGMVGTFLAVANIWILFGMFPGVVGTFDNGELIGYENPHVWWIGAIDGAVFGFLILFLNVDIALKMFALSWHVYFIMTFLDPNPGTGGFNTGFALSVRGPAISALCMSGIGAGMAVIASLVPFPMWALDKARRSAQHIVKDLDACWEASLVCFAGPINPAANANLKRLIDGLTDDSNALSGHIDTAWWECLGRGNGQKVRLAMRELTHSLTEAYQRLCTLFKMTEQLDGNRRHTDAMAALTPALAALKKAASQLMFEVSAAAEDGHMDDDELRRIVAHRDEVFTCMANLTDAFTRQVHGVDEDLMTCGAFCLSFCTYGRIATDFANTLVKMNSQPIVPETASLMTPFNKTALLDKSHLNFVLRSSLSLFASFVLGYNGYSAILQKYNSGPAGTVALLISTSVGGAILKNLGRLQGAVLGTAVGQLGWAILAWCTLVGFIEVAMALFVWCTLTLFVYYNSSEYGYIGCLLAAFGAQALLQGCSAEVFGQKQQAATYYMIVNTVMGIATMTLVDMTLLPARASDLARGGLHDAWGLYKTAIQKALDPKDTKVRHHFGIMNAKVSGALSMAQQAYNEPRWWRTPFKAHLFADACYYGQRIREHLCNLECSSAVDGRDGSAKDEVMIDVAQYAAFADVKEDLNCRIETLTELFGIFGHELAGDFEIKGGEENIGKRENQEKTDRLVGALVQEVKKRMPVAGGDPSKGAVSLENNRFCKISLFLAALKCQFSEMTILKNVILCSFE